MRINLIQNGNFNRNSYKNNNKNQSFGHVTMNKQGLDVVSKTVSKEVFSNYVEQLKKLHSIQLNLCDVLKDYDITKENQNYNFLKNRYFRKLTDVDAQNVAKDVINKFIKTVGEKESKDYTFRIAPKYSERHCEPEAQDYYGQGIKIYKNEHDQEYGNEFRAFDEVSQIVPDVIEEVKLSTDNMRIAYMADHIDYNNPTHKLGHGEYFALPTGEESLKKIVRTAIMDNLNETILTILKKKNNIAVQQSENDRSEKNARFAAELQ